jgi:prepilin-type N-terminal cleavage/methylation domain-containing protein
MTRISSRSDSAVDNGFTLIELLIGVTILVMILGAIGTAMTVAFRTISTQRQTVTDSAGAQLLVSYLASDAQSADGVQPTDFNCGGGGLLELRWLDADKNFGMVDVVYKIEAGSAGDSQLTRYRYTLSRTATDCDTPTSSQSAALVLSVDPAHTTTWCDGVVSCSSSSTIVGMRVVAFSGQPKNGNYSSYTFDVTGSRRMT